MGGSRSPLKDAENARMTVELTTAMAGETPPNLDSMCEAFEEEMRNLQETDRMSAFARAIFELNEISRNKLVSEKVRIMCARDASDGESWARKIYDNRAKYSMIALDAEIDRGIAIIVKRAIMRRREMAKLVKEAWDRIIRLMRKEVA